MSRGRGVLTSAAALLMDGGELEPAVTSMATRTTPAPPTNLRLAGVPNSFGVPLTWNPAVGSSPDIEYFVEQDNFAFSWYQGSNVTTCTIRPFDWRPGVTHTFAVYAMDPAAPNHPSAVSNKITVTAPPDAMP